MPAPTIKMTHEVIPRGNSYSRHFFAFIPECGHDCSDEQFGVKGLSSDVGFLPDQSIGQSPLPKAIGDSVGSTIDEYDIDKFLEINYEAAGIQAVVMKANMPLARAVLFCPPCLVAMTTAIAICEDRETELAQWRVRVDHRLGCKCCPDARSGRARIEMIADTIADVESGNHWAKRSAPEAMWISYIDRAWLEQLLYYEDADGVSSKTALVETAATTQDDGPERDYAGMRQMLTFDLRVRPKVIAVILADVENGAWIINSKPFPVVKRHPRAGEMYSLKRDSSMKMARCFMGTFATKGALKRRRDDSPPPTTSANKRATGDST